jgi:hypothetical protein
MTNPLSGASPIVYARLAGVLYLIIFLMAPFAEFFVREALIVKGDATATAEHRGLGGVIPRGLRQ